MNEYRLVIRAVNTYDQTSLTTITGKDHSGYSFLERCFQLVEEEVLDPGLEVVIEEPEDFGCAGGFCSSTDMWKLFEGDIENSEILAEFPW